MKTIIPGRKIEGISALLLPFHEDGKPDYDSFLAHVDRTYAAGLMQRKRLCRTFSDCTTAPRNGLVSGCYPLDEFYKGDPKRKC
jgi:hypothetical protein